MDKIRDNVNKNRAPGKTKYVVLRLRLYEGMVPEGLSNTYMELLSGFFSNCYSFCRILLYKLQ
ncbi:MAG: hypothetical protein A2W86_05200 [Bacteroidetes bacterium GWD2_45_23]|nr:MAG: hypothetical protein A2W87_12430 [Bacteroidetes bacterium GWC2_46_850]OFX75307.1 MAG: hypothetical protein A2071_12750 [Bacteroidetes bacterium GWC1_47_7]OFX87571.1 MAG: hypothetical protein A2W86_05200 [Bacteroidetes bacterium GWD2_45_23]HBB01477.1 hypothetical protein [Porphyromonadaceae bacterium]HCC19074.1 hypothetical protein [Porphyromonadaceae bacterium]